MKAAATRSVHDHGAWCRSSSFHPIDTTVDFLFVSCFRPKLCKLQASWAFSVWVLQGSSMPWEWMATSSLACDIMTSQMLEIAWNCLNRFEYFEYFEYFALITSAQQAKHGRCEHRSTRPRSARGSEADLSAYRILHNVERNLETSWNFMKLQGRTQH